MSFELTPLAKRIFLNDTQSSDPEPQKSNAQNNIFNIGYPYYQMPTFGFNFGADVFSMYMNMQNMMQLFSFPQLPQPLYQMNDFNYGKLDYSNLFNTPVDFNNTNITNTNTPPKINTNNTVPLAQKPNAYNNHKYSSTSVTTPYSGTAEDLNNSLKGKGLLEGKGEKLIELQKKYGVNAAFIAAIARAESGGKSRLARENNNLTGITNPGGHGFRKFKSVDECLEYTAKLIKTNYVDKNLTTIAQIHKKYCPIGANNDPKAINHNWGFVVGSCMNDMMV